MERIKNGAHGNNPVRRKFRWFTLFNPHNWDVCHSTLTHEDWKTKALVQEATAGKAEWGFHLRPGVSEAHAASLPTLHQKGSFSPGLCHHSRTPRPSFPSGFPLGPCEPTSCQSVSTVGDDVLSLIKAMALLLRDSKERLELGTS